jgi:predicted permease
MNSMLHFFRRLRILLRRKRFESELEEEMAFHREQKEKEFEANGETKEEARYAARREFGGATQLKEESRDVVGFQFETAAQDFRFAVRQLRKNSGFAATAIFVLALGICASVAIFAFVDAALVKPLPYHDPTRLVGVYEAHRMIPHSNLSLLDYEDWKKQNKSFSSFDIYTGTSFLLNAPGGTKPVPGTRVSDGFFRTLGVTPVLGRDFYAGEDAPNGPATALLSYAGWQKLFGGRPDVVGQTVRLSGTATTIIGVLPKEFHFSPQGGAEFWTTVHDRSSCEKRRSCHNLYGVARLRDGLSIETAEGEMKGIAQQLESQYPDSNRGQGAAVIPLSEAIVGEMRPLLLVLLSGAGLLLLIACVNVVNLLLVRSESRRREIAVREALGASPARLIRQFVTEGLALVVTSSVLGVISAIGLMKLLLRLIPQDLMDDVPYLQGLSLNFRVLAFAGLIALFAAMLYSITPALQLSFSKLREGLTEGGRGASGTLWRRFCSNLVVVELAIAVVMLVGAGLLGKSFYRLLHVNLGFHPDHLATLEVEAPEKIYGKDPDAVALEKLMLSRMAALPGVQSVGFASRLALSGNGNTTWMRIVGKPFNGEHNDANEREVSSGYLATLQAKLLRGRFFAETDDASRPGVAIINQALAQQYFPNEDPIGQKIGDNGLSAKSIREIVGVVDNVRESSLDTETWPTIYIPFNQSPENYFSVVVRTSQAEESILPTLDATVREIDGDIGTRAEATMAQIISESPTAYLHRSSAWLIGGFAVLALVLGVVGLYGVISYSVSQRTREIGVRMALGAQPTSVYRLILKDAGWLTALGIVVGLGCSVAAATLMRKVLFGVESWDLPTLAGVAAVLGLFALLASYIPAHRAASLDPVEVLRAE